MTHINGLLLETLASNPAFICERGIYRQRKFFTPTQQQTADSFGFKWAKRETFESPQMATMQRAWIYNRYKVTEGALHAMIQGRTFLDAGCGAALGALTTFGEMLNDCAYLGVDISAAVDVASARFQDRGIRGEFVQASLMEIPAEVGNFDFIYSEGVLHHTDSTEAAINCLAHRLNPGGHFMFYVYGKKAPMREHADDYIRELIAPLSDPDAWKALEPLTKLGIALGQLHAEIDVPEAVEVLGIPAGKLDVQRFFYWYFCKTFYRPDFTLDEMNHINFD